MGVRSSYLSPCWAANFSSPPQNPETSWINVHSLHFSLRWHTALGSLASNMLTGDIDLIVDLTSVCLEGTFIHGVNSWASCVGL